MPRLFGAILGLAVAASFVPAAPVPAHLMPRDPPLAFPTTVGTTWVYERPGGGEETIVISEVKEEQDGSRLVTTEYVEAGKRTPHQIKRISAQGVFVLVDGGQKFAEPLFIVKLPFREGQTWETNHRREGEPNESRGKRVAGPQEKVKVPAGEFSAVSIEWHLDGAKGRNWYVNGIGLVKSGDSMQLKSFKLGKD